MKKLIIAVILVCVLMYSFPKYLQYKNTKDQINAYLDENDYQKDVISKEMDYDYKLGYFYMVVYFEAYPEREYVYSRYQGAISGIAFEKDAQIETTDYLAGMVLDESLKQ